MENMDQFHRAWLGILAGKLEQCQRLVVPNLHGILLLVVRPTLRNSGWMALKKQNPAVSRFKIPSSTSTGFRNGVNPGHTVPCIPEGFSINSPPKLVLTIGRCKDAKLVWL